MIQQVIRDDEMVSFCWEAKDIVIRPKAHFSLTLRVRPDGVTELEQAANSLHTVEDFEQYTKWIREAHQILQTSNPPEKVKKIFKKNLRPNTLYRTVKGQYLLYVGKGKFAEYEWFKNQPVSGANVPGNSYVYARIADPSALTFSETENAVVLQYKELIDFDVYVTQPSDCVEAVKEFFDNKRLFDCYNTESGTERVFKIVRPGDPTITSMSYDELSDVWDAIPYGDKSSGCSIFAILSDYLAKTVTLTDEQKSAVYKTIMQDRSYSCQKYNGGGLPPLPITKSVSAF